MTPTDITLVSIAFVLFVAAPYLPTSVYTLTFTSYYIPFLLLIVLLGSMAYSRIGSLTLLLAFAALFVEFRKRIIDTTFDEPSYEKQMAPAAPIVPTEIHPPYEAPDAELVAYKPSQETGSDTFSPVDASINQKEVLPTSRLPVQAEEFLIENGLAERPSN